MENQSFAMGKLIVRGGKTIVRARSFGARGERSVNAERKKS